MEQEVAFIGRLLKNRQYLSKIFCSLLFIPYLCMKFNNKKKKGI